MSILKPDGTPANAIPQQVLMQVLQNHEARIAALASQQIHLGIMVEYLTEKLEDAVPEFAIDQDEFSQFLQRRWSEMQEEAKQVAASRESDLKLAEQVREEVAATQPRPTLNLNFSEEG